MRISFIKQADPDELAAGDQISIDQCEDEADNGFYTVLGIVNSQTRTFQAKRNEDGYVMQLSLVSDREELRPAGAVLH